MKQLIQFVLISLVGAMVAGCASAPSQFYALNSTAQANGAPAVKCSVIVNPVFVPASVDQPQFVITTAPNRVEVDEFNRWDAPLDDAIARVVRADLITLLGTPRVSSAPIADFGPAYHVTIRIERFESIRGDGKQSGEALVDAIWTVRDPGGEIVGSSRTTATELAGGNSFDAFAAAHSRALAKVSTDIATAIRMDVDKAH
jgi:uncharacterized lipoprotein YmbA